MKKLYFGLKCFLNGTTMPWTNALYILSILLFINFETVAIIFLKNNLSFIKIRLASSLISIALVIFLNYKFLYQKRNVIVNKFANECHRAWWTGCIYFIISLILFLSAVFIK